MRGLVDMSLVAVLLLSAGGCPAGGARVEEDMGADRDGDVPTDEEAPHEPTGDEPDAGLGYDAGQAPPSRPPHEPVEQPDEPGPQQPQQPEQPQEPEPTPRTEVPGELVGTWQAGSIDLDLWESYTEGYYAGRNAIPSRESMTFRADGSAKFYRYEFAFNFYEELVDCEGTVAFHDDGTFTFYPVEGRKRFYDTRYSDNNTDRALSAEELLDPTWAGTRAYTLDATSEPAVMRIVVPSSAPYSWYKVE
jgi:hypothetical protein